MDDELVKYISMMKDFNNELMELNIKYCEEIERLNDIINRIKSIYQILCFSAPENNYIFIEKLGEVLLKLKESDKDE